MDINIYLLKLVVTTTFAITILLFHFVSDKKEAVYLIEKLCYIGICEIGFFNLSMWYQLAMLFLTITYGFCNYSQGGKYYLI